MPGEPTPSPDGAPTPGVAARITLPLRAIGRWIWIGVTVLIVATFVVQFVREAFSANTIVNLLDSDQKLNVPSTAKLLLMLSATALFAIVGLASPDRHRRVRWLGMSAIFGFVTLDEFNYLHQRLSDLLHDKFGVGGVLRFAWVLVYLPIVAVLAIVYLPFWRGLPSRLKYRLLAAAILFAGGSGLVEFAKSALYDDERWTLSFGLIASFSDSLELIGLALLVTVLLEHLATLTCEVQFRLDPT